MTNCKKIRETLWAALVPACLLLLVCTNPLSNLATDEAAEGTGSLLIYISSVTPKTLIPGLDMNPVEYMISGEGPNSDNFSSTTATPPVMILGLHFGDWSVTAEALNKDYVVIGRCVQQVKIYSGVTQSLSAVVKPLDGYGTLSLTVTWPAADTENPVVRSQLVPKTGAVIDLAFTMSSPGTATCTKTQVPTGYYTLVLQLFDQLQTGDKLAIGAVDMVRIIKDQTTSGVFDFPEVNDPPGKLTITITPDLADPIAVTLSGQVAQINEGGSMTISASVPAATGNVIYAWYLNGGSMATGPSITVGSGLKPGVYRLDVTAYAADGSRAGSATCSFRVNAVVLTQATLIWDANSETNLAGYKLHYGPASGSYTAVVDIGNHTTYTLTGLEAGKTYYIAATAYNTGGKESLYSNEVIFRGL